MRLLRRRLAARGGEGVDADAAASGAAEEKAPADKGPRARQCRRHDAPDVEAI